MTRRNSPFALVPLVTVSVALCLGAWAADLAYSETRTRGSQDGASRKQAADTEPNVETVGRTLQEIETRYVSGAIKEKSFKIDEAGANQYLRHRAAAELKDGISNPWIRFENGLAILGARVNLDKIKNEMPDNMIIRFLSGTVPVEITAKVESSSGQGNIALERIIMSGIELPASFVEDLARKHGTGGFLPEGFKLGEPFRLPYALEEIRLGSRSIEIRQRGVPSAAR